MVEEFFVQTMNSQTLFSLKLTAKVSLWVLVLHVLLGIPLAWYLGSGKSLLRNTMEIIVTFPLIFPPIASGFLLLLLLGRFSFIGQILHEFLHIQLIFTQSGLVIASFSAGLPLVVRPIQAAIAGIPQNLVEASLTLGKSRIKTFFYVILPLIKKNILTGLGLGLGRSLGEVGITLMIGGNILGKTNTLSLEVYNAVFEGDYYRAGILSALLLFLSLMLFAVLKKMDTSSVS